MEQAVKDSFYMELRTRVSAANPARTIVWQGATRPAVMVAENEVSTAKLLPNDCFVLWWSVPRAVGEGITQLPCAITYSTRGTEDASFADRGRAAAKMDEELTAAMQPTNTEIKDYTDTPATGTGAMCWWSVPKMSTKYERELTQRRAEFTVFYLDEVTA